MIGSSSQTRRDHPNNPTQRRDPRPGGTTAAARELAEEDGRTPAEATRGPHGDHSAEETAR
jgi:hypothetical protein